MITERKAANAMAGNTARACDSCLVKRARWFCAADDAFLCQRCDQSVHSANQLASRHDRVRLPASSFKANDPILAADKSPPAWHRGFTRKARTPRHNNKPAGSSGASMGQQSGKSEGQERVILDPPLPFVPEMGCEEANCLDDEENEDLEQLLYRVPIYDPFAAELCNMSSDVGNSTCAINLDDEEIEIRMGNHEVGEENNYGGHDDGHELDNLQGFLPSDMELAEFAADVENLLGGGLDEESSDINGVLGLLDSKEEDVNVCMNNNSEDTKAVKVEEEEGGMEFNPSILDWNFDSDESSPALLMGAQSTDEVLMDNKEQVMMKRKIFLRLNYEAVITAWASQGSPWTTGTRPEVNPNDGWPDYMGMWPIEVHQAPGDSAGSVGGRGDNRGREARVSRYREKRRTRLFSKKIRYEVRKLNAEKRPRMKGRFVKRTNAAAFPYLINK